MNSFIGWIGGKRALRNEILQRIPPVFHPFLQPRKLFFG